MKRALAILLNEIKLYVQDRGDLAFGLLLPIVTFALMYGAFGGQTTFTGICRIVNEDGGVYAQRLINDIDSADGVSISLLTRQDADDKLDRSDITFALYIPAGFSTALEAGNNTGLVFKQRGNGGTEGQILASIIRGAVADIEQQFLVQRQTTAALAEYNLSGDLVELSVSEVIALREAKPVVTVNETTTGGKPDFIYQFLPGIVTMYVLFALSLSARTIVEERRRGTLERLLTTQLTVGEMFFGKYISFVARGFIQTLLLLLLSYAVFQMFTPLSFVTALLIALIFSAAATAVGMIIASMARTEDGATWFGVVFTMAMVMLGGTFFEVSQGTIFATISKFSINTYANDAFRAVIAEGGSLVDTGYNLVVLAIVAVAGLVLSRWLFRAVGGRK
ncbi:MAG: ABC transporter permease [Dehalogenimonas sp.]|uniref:ABC transporter permease n=1 Tax=Candidatus Dehalogenimonas loeffleri TaxID=3127115 RepID=A0ABZ2J3N8_9CHLR|nr:ABC transporter permease [Dehalogenimonas sp.]